jgi:hemin uptake protein HemP
MVDSTQILDAGWRAPDPRDGGVLPDGILKFFEATTSTPLEVFADADLTETLGTEVSCDDAGFPVTSGNAKTLIYTGVDAYKIRLTSVDYGGTVFEFDEVKGALDTSNFLTTEAVASEPIVNTSSNRTITPADQGKLINVNCTASTLTMTLNAASVLGADFKVGIRHDGTANQVRITGNGTDQFGLPGQITTAFSLVARGQVIWIGTDGSSFKVSNEVPALLGALSGIITCADRLSTPPGSPTAGARYIVTAAPTGAWSTFAEHDIAEATGFGTWFKFTPPADSGWLSYVQDEDLFYAFSGSNWVGTTIHINSLSEDTTPDKDADFIGTFDVSAGQPKKVKINTIVELSKPVLETAQQTTSGTAFDFTAIPSWAKRIHVLFDKVSLSGTDHWLVQIGDSGGIETSVYDSISGDRNAETASTAGFVIRNVASTTSMSGIMTIILIDQSNTWVSSHSVNENSANIPRFGGGTKTLSAQLDRLRVTVTGANTFDAGQVNIMYD